MNELGPWKYEANLDRWVKRDHWPGKPLCCSFCGSLQPEVFLEALQNGAEIGPTDKSYKAYLHLESGKLAAEFYFQHLDEAQQNGFITLINEGKLRFGYPGHFYVLPYFMRFADRKDPGE